MFHGYDFIYKKNLSLKINYNIDNFLVQFC